MEISWIAVIVAAVVKLWAIGNGYQLVGLLVMGAILGCWHAGIAGTTAA